MVDWKTLYEKWEEVPEETKSKIRKLFSDKAKENPDKLVAFLKENVWAKKVLEKTYPSLLYMIGMVPEKVPEKPPAPAIPALPGLSDRDEQRIKDQFFATLSKKAIRITSGMRSEFRHEMTLATEEIKDLPGDEAYKKAKERLDKLAEEIIERETERKLLRRVAPPRVPRVVRVAPPPEEVPIIPAVMPPAKFPTAPLSDLPFPRRPTSEEQKRLWEVFAYELQDKGMSYWEHGRLFEERINNITFKDWAMVRDRFNHLIEAIVTGEELPELWVWKGVPPPSLEFLWKPTIEPTEARAEAIRHFTSVVIRNARSAGEVPTLAELRVTLEQYGVTHVTHDEIKEAIMEGYKREDPWFANISIEELDRFLET